MTLKTRSRASRMTRVRTRVVVDHAVEQLEAAAGRERLARRPAAARRRTSGSRSTVSHTSASSRCTSWSTALRPGRVERDAQHAVGRAGRTRRSGNVGVAVGHRGVPRRSGTGATVHAVVAARGPRVCHRRRVTGTVLLTGGAGYIGSHTAVELLARRVGRRGRRRLLQQQPHRARPGRRDRRRTAGAGLAALARGSTSATPPRSTDGARATRRRRGRPLRRAQGGGRVGGRAAAVLHGERGRHRLAAAGHGRPPACGDLVFSSSCTVYGDPERVPVDETAPPQRHQPLRPHQAHHRGHARRHWRPATTAGACCRCATSTRSAPTPAAASARTPRASPTT